LRKEEYPLITLERIQKTYRVGDRAIQAVAELDLRIDKGEIFGIIGHSGAGKSTLLRCVNLLERPDTGKVWMGDVDLTSLPPRKLQEQRRKIGMIFQHFNLLDSATAEANIALPMRLAKQPEPHIRQRVRELLELVGLDGHGHKYPSQLSGGQKQRVGIARALANDPDVLLCDEATSALDPQTTQSILALLLDINRKLGITILLITHEMQVIRTVCDRVAVMDKGTIVESGTVSNVFLNPRHEVTREFLRELNDTPAGLLGDAGKTGLKAPNGGTLVQITMIGKMTYEPVLFDAVKLTGASFAILQGTVGAIKQTPYGQLLVELTGSQADIDRVIKSLADKGLSVEVLAS